PQAVAAAPPRRWEWAVLAGIVGLAILARYSGLTQGFPRDYHWDERLYFHESFYTLANGLAHDSTLSANLPYLLDLVVLTVGLPGFLGGSIHNLGDLIHRYLADPQPFVLAGRSVWAAAGVASVLVVYRIGRRLAGPVVGLSAAFFLAIAYIHVAEGHFIKNDGPAGLWLLLALDRCLSIQARGTRRDYLWAGLWIGLAAATKYYCVALAPAILLAHLLRPATAAAPRRVRDLLYAAFSAGAAILVTTPMLALDPLGFVRLLIRDAALGHPALDTGGSPQWLFYLTEHLSSGLGWPLLALGVLGLVPALRLGPPGWLLTVFTVGFYGALNLVPANFARYIVPLVPLLCLSAALALWQGGQIGARLLGARAVPRWSGLVVLPAVVLLVSSPSWLALLRYSRLAAAPDTRNAAQVWFERAVPAGATVLIEGGTAFEQFSNLGPQLWPLPDQIAALGAAPPSETLFRQQLLAVDQAHPVTYRLTLIGAVDRRNVGPPGNWHPEPLTSMADQGWPDYALLLNWRSAALRPGSDSPLWRSLTDHYTLVQTFACAPCFPDDPYNWNIDPATLARIAPFGGPPVVAGPAIRVFQRTDTAFRLRAMP
ncbi:MAG: glycosyltransferase family 39 protein, partial [Chloroflexota bacterium]|nr:glycosyltransferase family 39 protein [Chloroflexota bacterium]